MNFIYKLNGFRSGICFIWIILCLVFVPEENSFADGLDYKLMSKLFTAKKVTFVLVPWMDLGDWIHIEKWDESTFKRIGCTYTTEDPKQIGSLIEIIERGDYESAPPKDTPFKVGDSNIMDAREGVYLTLADGNEVRFLFGPENNLAHVQTQLNLSSDPKDYFKYANNKHLPWYLTYWASHLENPTTDSTIISGKETEAECEKMFKRYVYSIRVHPRF